MTDRVSRVAWVREHSRLSVHTLRRRFRVTAAEANRMIAEMVDGRVLGREPEGESYRVLYSRRRREHPDWFNPQGVPDRRYTQSLEITSIVRTSQGRAA